MADLSWVHELFAKFDQGDIEGWASYLSEDASFRMGSGVPVSGPQGAKQVISAILTMARNVRHDLLDVWQTPEGVVVRGEISMHRIKDGRRITLPFCNVFDVKEQRIQRYLAHLDPSPIFA
ncbi:MAG: nuclear transport factor 2 family protein [Myxococcaceae bacterium]|nr:nuclear transport factor 2 family protein [Myxococcaceae bacterium]